MSFNILKKIGISVFCTCGMALSLFAQSTEINKDSLVSDKMYFVNNLFKYGEDIMKEQGGKAAIEKLRGLESSIVKEDDSLKKSFYYQVMMTFYSFIDHEKSLEYEFKAFPYKNSDSEQLSGDLKIHDASQYIAERFADANVILINESHNSSQHRAFLRDLLPELRKMGFNYLLLEALFEDEIALSKRKYPILTSGLYLNDPVFSQVIRNAFSLGYNVLQLERDSESEDREEEQASRIDSVLNADSKAKIIVFVGHDHIYKIPKNGYKWMGNILVGKLGHDVPSIELTTMQEKFDINAESGIYKEAVRRFSEADKPFVVFQNDSAFVSSGSKGYVDFHVFFPRTDIRFGLPEWAMHFTDKEIVLNLDIKQGIVVKVFVKRERVIEGNLAVPVIQFEANANLESLKLKLPPDLYQIELIDVKSDEIRKVEFEIE